MKVRAMELLVGQVRDVTTERLGGLLKMRFYGLAVLAGVAGVVACARAEKTSGDTTALGVDTSTIMSTGGTTSAGTTVATATMAPITGTIHQVKMIGDAKSYRFEPANITVKQGDGIKWTTVSGGPHSVAFDSAAIPADVRPQLDANMGTDRMAELSSNMKMNPGESVTISFANIKPGQYPYHCVPHFAMDMTGVVTVQ
jgi:plastocyanin